MHTGEGSRDPSYHLQAKLDLAAFNGPSTCSLTWSFLFYSLFKIRAALFLPRAFYSEVRGGVWISPSIWYDMGESDGKMLLTSISQWGGSTI